MAHNVVNNVVERLQYTAMRSVALVTLEQLGKTHLVPFSVEKRPRILEVGASRGRWHAEVLASVFVYYRIDLDDSDVDAVRMKSSSGEPSPEATASVDGQLSEQLRK